MNKTVVYPCHLPVSVRGAAALTYQGRLTLLGGLSMFSQTFHSDERTVIWKYQEEDGGSWGPLEVETMTIMAARGVALEGQKIVTGIRKMTRTSSMTSEQVRLPLPLLDTYAFSIHL